MPERYTSRIMRVLTRRDYDPLKPRQLARALKVPDEHYDLFREAINLLHRQGRLTFGERNTLCLPEMTDRLVGVFRPAKGGFGFVQPKHAHAEGDLYIPQGFTLNALRGDTVEAKVESIGRGDRRTGRILSIIERAHTEFTGTLFREGRQWYVKPDGRELTEPISVDDPSAKNAQPGDKVVVEILSYPTGDYYASGVITQRLGKAGAASAELLAVIHRFGLEEKFQPATRREARNVSAAFDHVDHAADRTDLRNDLIVTVDPADARDFDDAISLEKRRDGSFRLGVHIADVSYFVQPESALDEEARRRATSCYLPQHVVPMLPELLSNGVCSLQEARDRFVKSAWIELDREGKVLRTEFANSVIRSKRRFTYEEVDEILEGHSTTLDPDLHALVFRMAELARILLERRRKNGMLELEIPKAQLVYDDKGHVIDAHPESTTFSHKIIEMFMVEANEAVARLLDSLNVPFLRRIHPEPDTLSVGESARVIKESGYIVPRDISREGIRDLLDRVRGRPESFVINLLILKSLQRAEYSPVPMGHYALASDHYAHFTSPIRRYPDLTVHRLLDAWLTGRLNPQTVADFPSHQELLEIGDHCSQAERNAEDAEDDLREFKILQLLANHVGEEVKAVVTSIVNFGVFVQLEKFLIEGLIRPEHLPRRSPQDAPGKRPPQSRDRSGRPQRNLTEGPYRMGQEITVRIANVDLPGRLLDLVPVETQQQKPRKSTEKTRQEPQKHPRSQKRSQKSSEKPKPTPTPTQKPKRRRKRR